MSLIAINTSQAGAESWQPTPNTVIISITDDGEPLAKLPDAITFRTQFYDVTEPLLFGGTWLKPIRQETARELARFIREHKDSNFLVHCRAGVSRSAAVCLFIHTAHGHQLKENFWALAEPNPLVLGRLLVQHFRV